MYNILALFQRLDLEIGEQVQVMSALDKKFRNFQRPFFTYCVCTKGSPSNGDHQKGILWKIIMLTTSLEVNKKWWTTEEINSAIEPWREIAYRL